MIAFLWEDLIPFAWKFLTTFLQLTIIFCNNECEQIIKRSYILVWFEVVSRLRVNLNKSSMLLVREVDNAHVMSCILSCGSDSLPSLYLGLSLGAKFKEKSIWEPVIARSHKRLSSCESQVSH